MKAVRVTLIVASTTILLGVGAVFVFFTTFKLRANAPEPAPPGPPAELSAEARRHLDAEGVAVTPTLEEVRASGDITPRAVTDALIAFGYPAKDIDVIAVKQNDAWSVAFGVTFEDGCVTGVVAPTEVSAGAMGEYNGYGCIPPELYPPT